MNLLVPHVRQPEESVDCGVACVEMLLQYYDISYDYRSLRKELDVKGWGTSTPSLAMALIKRGLEVEIVTMNPNLFNLDSEVLSREAMLIHLRFVQKHLHTLMNKYVMKHFIQFVEMGGMLTPRIPNAVDIRTEVGQHRPLICQLTHWFLQPNNELPFLSSHFNVITGIEDQQIFVNDPDLAQKKVYAIEAYLFGIYAAAGGAIDNACVMKVKRASL